MAHGGIIRSWLLQLPVLLAFLVVSASTYHQANKLTEEFSWKSLDFDYPTPEQRKAAIDSKAFIPGGLVPIDVDVYTRGGHERENRTIFVTIPRFQDGVPVTLGTVTSRKNADGNPLIAPYPNWEMQKPGGDCEGITSVYRVAVDACDRLWVMDTGRLGKQRACPPQLLVYDLKTNVLLRRHRLPIEQYINSSQFITPSVDMRDTCDDTYVYIADVGAFALIVYDYTNDRSWKIVNKLFYPYPEYGTIEINNDSFDLMDGIFGLALGPIKRDGDRILYFHSLASRKESWVPTSVIRNYTIFKDNAESSIASFNAFPCERSSQSGPQAMDHNGVLFYGLMSDTAIGCWNSQRYPEFGGGNIKKIVTNRKTLQFASGLKVVNPKSGDPSELWVMTVSFQKFMAGTMTPNVTNFRIQSAKIDQLVRGTKCEVLRRRVPNHRSSFKGNPSARVGYSYDSVKSRRERDSYGSSLRMYEPHYSSRKNFRDNFKYILRVEAKI